MSRFPDLNGFHSPGFVRRTYPDILIRAAALLVLPRVVLHIGMRAHDRRTGRDGIEGRTFQTPTLIYRARECSCSRGLTARNLIVTLILNVTPLTQRVPQDVATTS